MRIFRYEDPEGNEHWGEERPDGSKTRLKGDLLGKLEQTDEPVEIALLRAPLDPKVIIGIALNYRRHAAETGKETPDRPVFFMKNLAATQCPNAPVVLPSVSEKVDYEAELAFVIGRAAKNVTEAEALDYVLGYTCANDVSARDWQWEWGGGQFCRGKSFDASCPIGPVLVTGRDRPDPSSLQIRMHLNGEMVQNSNTSDMVFSVPQLIAFLSQDTTLLPGTVVLTGTPEGVGAGRTPQRFLRDGDVCTVEIEGIGQLTNPVVATTVPTAT